MEPDSIPAAVRAYAHARCERFEQCDCEITSYDDRAQCEAKLLQIYQDNIAGRDTVDLDCFGDAARLWERAPCDEAYEGEACEVTSQTDTIGEPCRLKPFLDMFLEANTCAEGLDCTAQERCGEFVHGIEAGMPCSPERLCSNGLTCIGGLCEEHRSEGEACESSSNCEPRELYCHDGVCVPRKAEGAPCTQRRECETNDQCFNGQCTRLEPLICGLAQF